MSEPGTKLVMLIDDEPAQSRLISAIAARDGWRTVVASDAETAVAMLGKHSLRRMTLTMSMGTGTALRVGYQGRSSICLSLGLMG